MNFNRSQYFSTTCGKICNILYVKHYDRSQVNTLIDELNAEPYKAELFVRIHDAQALITSLCLNIKPVDESLAAKTSHLMISILTKQNLSFDANFLQKVITWHIQCLRTCSEIVLPDLLHNLQCVVQLSPHIGFKFISDLVGDKGILIKFLKSDHNQPVGSPDTLQIIIISLKCICLLTAFTEENKTENNISSEIKQNISELVLQYLLRGVKKSQDEFLYCKAVILALRVLSQLYLNEPKASPILPEVMGICRFFIVYGLVVQGLKPEKLMPSQQTIAPVSSPVVQNSKGGKKQKLRKQRNSAIENIKKEIPTLDHSLLRDMDHFENNLAYKPATRDHFDTSRVSNLWVLTSDSDLSDVESGKEAKLAALKSRVRQSASNLLLVLVKVVEKRDMFGYWWALLPDCPTERWNTEESARKTIAYCAAVDSVASSRAAALSVMLEMLGGSRTYLSQAESSKKESTSFTPFSVSLGNMLCCTHTVLASILDNERSQQVSLVALKCCAALLQATPYHKMRPGLISMLVRTTRRFLLHRDVTLQVGALIVMGCVVSVNPPVDEVLASIQKYQTPLKPPAPSNQTEDDCQDFEEGYSDDEMFTVDDDKMKSDETECRYFSSWILDICFKNMGWLFRNNIVTQCTPSATPVVLESLQVLSALCFHHLPKLLAPHLPLLAEVLGALIERGGEVALHAAQTLSVLADRMLLLEQTDECPPLSQRVHLWERLVPPLSAALQSPDNAPLKACACDCIANIGDKTFSELPRRLQVVCCTLVVGSCSDEQATVRAAAVRALAMMLQYRDRREDICFVSDCGENILRALNENTLVTRVKAAWALGTLSDVLVLNLADPDIESIDDDLFVRLMEASVHCAQDNDKVKMSATRGLGNLLRLITEEKLFRVPRLKPLFHTAMEKLVDCACRVSNMKVRWNACHALGNAMKNEALYSPTLSGWQRQVFPCLCTLAQECKNVKVRINAAGALRSCVSRVHYGDAFSAVWRGIMVAMETVANLHDFNEYKHKDNLIEQLCVTLSYLCCLLSPSDLLDIADPLSFHGETARSFIASLSRRLPPEHPSCGVILRAARHVTVDLTAENESQAQTLSMLHNIFIWDM